MTTFEFGGTTANLMKSCERTYDNLKVLEKIILGDIPIHVPEKGIKSLLIRSRLSRDLRSSSREVDELRTVP